MTPCIWIRRWRLCGRTVGKRKGLFNKFHMSGDINLTKTKIKAVICISVGEYLTITHGLDLGLSLCDVYGRNQG